MLLKALGFLYIRKSIIEGTTAKLIEAIETRRFPHKDLFFSGEKLNNLTKALNGSTRKRDAKELKNLTFFYDLMKNDTSITPTAGLLVKNMLLNHVKN